MNGNSTIQDLSVPVEAENPGKCWFCGKSTPPGLTQCQDIESCIDHIDKVEQDGEFEF